MSSIHIRAPAKNRLRAHTRMILLACVLMVSAPAIAAEIITIKLESEVLDLDTGTVIDALIQDPTIQTGADLQLAYNADRTPHAVVVPVGEGVELAFLANVGFEDISSSDVPTLVFSTEPTDSPLSDNDCVVIRSDQGTFFKLGNASESGLSITFSYESL